MPMNFPDLKSLKNRAEVRGFRKINENETENEYRNALANYMQNIDLIESMEIRTGSGWDEWDNHQQKETLVRALLNK